MVVSKGNVRVSKIDTYLNCAEVFAYRSTCLKRKYGAVIVKDDVVISTGYNGSPRGFENCCEIGSCPRRPGGKFCVSVFRQNQEYHVFNVHDGGLFPLVTSLPEGWDGMRADTA